MEMSTGNEEIDQNDRWKNDGPINKDGGQFETGAVGNSKRNARRTTKSVSDNEGWLCEMCNVSYKKKNDKILECDYCSKHYCIQCLDMPAKTYNMLSTRVDVKWFCPMCNEKVEKNLKADRQIEEKCREFMESFENRVKTLEEKADMFVTVEEVRQLISNTQTSSTSGPKPTYSNEAQVSESVLKEMTEREKRKNNAIILRVPEPSTNIKLERINADIQVVKDIGKHVQVKIEDDDIIRVSRLGKKKDSSNVEDSVKNARPLLITFRDENIKKKVFMNASKLKGIAGPLQSVTIDHDMTQKERERKQRT